MAACASATASASCRWKAGTARPTASRATDDPPLAELRQSGAKLIWGGEAVAVRHDGRANPNQLLIVGRATSRRSPRWLRDELVAAHRERFGANADRDLYLGLQLTHSGRFSRPNARIGPSRSPRYAIRFSISGSPPASRADRRRPRSRLVDEFIAAARVAPCAIGFQFVDIKHCHGYLGHELLERARRAGRYGGTLENRTRFSSP